MEDELKHSVVVTILVGLVVINGILAWLSISTGHYVIALINISASLISMVSLVTVIQTICRVQRAEQVREIISRIEEIL